MSEKVLSVFVCRWHTHAAQATTRLPTPVPSPSYVVLMPHCTYPPLHRCTCLPLFPPAAVKDWALGISCSVIFVQASAGEGASAAQLVAAAL